VSRFLITGSYGTFEVSKIVEASSEDHVWAETGILSDLERAGWSVSDVDGEDWSIELLGPVTK